MFKMYVISYANKNARYAQTRAAAGGVVILPATDKVSAAKAGERVLARDSTISGVREAVDVFAPDDIQLEPPLKQRSA